MHIELGHARPVALCGGVYNNHFGLAAFKQDAARRGAETLICLGDMGGFGPSPDKVFPLLRRDPAMYVMQGNYDHSIGNRLEDCACGYTDPRDNHFAQISYDYTAANTSVEHKDWLRDLPREFRFEYNGLKVLCAHGSPRKVNEFLWESACSDAFLEWVLEQAECDLLFVTHTGIPWMRELSGGRRVVNVGAIGRPANNGRTSVDYAMLSVKDGEVCVELVELPYDHEALALEMQEEGLPEEFIETVRTGWWTTCLEIMPARERALGKF